MSVSNRLAPFGTSVFTEMTLLALEHDAINLGQGFPNWDGAAFVKKAATSAMAAGGHDQYPPSPGMSSLRDALVGHYGPLLGTDLDPETQVTVTCGCTEALACSFLGLIDPGDEVVLIEPFYDAYPVYVAFAGAVPRHITLRPPDFALDVDELRSVVNADTRAIVLNNPHNPTGHVFDRDELEAIAEVCLQHDVMVISDEVYEEMVYEGAHIRIATLDGMWERTLTLSSLGKTFSLTGWKVGWAIGHERLMSGLRSAHQFVTFTTPTPVQEGAVVALGAAAAFYDAMRSGYRAKRDLLGSGLAESGFDVHVPDGTYFLMAGHPGAGDDLDFCRRLATDAGVVAIPAGSFYSTRQSGSGLVRFAFCKDETTLLEAISRIHRFTT